MTPANFTAALAALALALAGCDAGRKTAETVPETATYEVRGFLSETLPDGRRAVIAHEAIAGYMEAMTMEFEAAEAGELAGLRPGDALAFRLSVTESRSWIDQVRKTGRGALPAVPPAAAAVALPEPGTLLPDCTLVDERGERLQLGEFRGRALAITFIYTRCPLPDFCPRMSERFSEVQLALSGVGGREAWHLLSISIDPQYDKPDRLAEYARRYSADPRRWTFATGKVEEVTKLAGFFGLAVVRDGAQTNHNLRTVVLDREGRVQRVFSGNQWTTTELAAELKRAIGGGG